MSNKKSLLLVSLVLALMATVVFASGASAAGRGPGAGRGFQADAMQAPGIQEDATRGRGGMGHGYAQGGGEARHAAALQRLLEKYGIEIPGNDWIGNVPSFDSVAEACAAAVQAEIDNAGLYDTALSSTTRRDLTNVFTNLQSASINKHLPAFEACTAQ